MTVLPRGAAVVALVGAGIALLSVGPGWVAAAPRSPSAEASTPVSAAPGSGASLDGLAFPGDGSTMPAAATAPRAVRLHEEAVVRRSFGLDASPAHVRRVDAGPHTTGAIGIPLSRAESRLVARRDGFGADADEITRAAASTPAFVRARVDGLSVVVEIAAPSRARAVALAGPLLASVPTDVPVRVRAVHSTAAEVQAVQDRVDRLTGADFRRLHLVGSGQDVAAQHIEIDVARDAPVGAEASVRALFPEPLVVIRRSDPVDFQSGSAPDPGADPS